MEQQLCFEEEALQNLTTKVVDRQRVLEDIQLDLLRRIRDHRVKHLQKKILRMLGEYHVRKTKLHEELLIAVHKKHQVQKIKEKTEREIKIIPMEHFGDEALQNITTKAVDRQKVLEDIQLDLLRRIRDHRVKHLQKKILRMLGEYHIRKTKLHEELLIAVHKKHQVQKLKEKTEREIKTTKAVDRRRVLEDIQLDLLRRIRDHRVKHLQKKILRMLGEYHIRKTKLHEELLIAVHKKHQVQKIKEKTEREIKTYQEEKQENYEAFLPRKLFFFGVETFRSKPKEVQEFCQRITQPDKEDSGEEEKDKADICQSAEENQPKEDKAKTKSMISRLKRFLGMK
ncbi:uncharacterized protein LOC111126481 [Crassostrea virginica]